MVRTWGSSPGSPICIFAFDISLQSSHGLFDLNSDMECLLNELEVNGLQKVDWKVEMEN